VQVAHNLQRGYFEWPENALARAHVLRMQPAPKVLAMRELRAQQAAIAERTRAEAAAQMATAAAATLTQTIAASAGAQGLLTSFNPSMWNSQIKTALLQMIHGERRAGTGVSGLGGDVNVLMADQEGGFENDDEVLDDVQHAAMQAGIAARNRRAVAVPGSSSGAAAGSGKRVREDGSTGTGVGAQRRAREKPAAEPTDPGPPTVSGYFTWLPGVSLCIVRDNGHTLTALKAFLGD
jgi:hypothetical protein